MFDIVTFYSCYYSGNYSNYIPMYVYFNSSNEYASWVKCKVRFCGLCVHKNVETT